MVKVFIAVQYQIVRDGITQIFSSIPEMTVIGAVKDPQELFTINGSEEIKIIILDLEIPNLDAINLIEKFTDHHPEIKILVLSDKEDSLTVRNIIQAGASGYLLKRCGGDELIKAVKKVYAGGKYLCDDSVSLLTKNIEGKGRITEREREVLMFICRELTNREIADELGISVRTVDSHRRNLLKKTGAKNTAGLVKYAIKYELFTL